MSERPTIHLTNASSKRLHSGTVFNIMAAPRRWERFAGKVVALAPAIEDLRYHQAAEISHDAYRRRFETRVEAWADQLRPGVLSTNERTVAGGDTLVCACSKRAAAAGNCHRAWAAPFLLRAGWRVVLDGVEVAL